LIVRVTVQHKFYWRCGAISFDAVCSEKLTNVNNKQLEIGFGVKDKKECRHVKAK